MADEAARVPVVMVRPEKPVSQMTPDEVKAFAKAFVDAMFGRYESAKAEVEKEIAEEQGSDS